LEKFRKHDFGSWLRGAPFYQDAGATGFQCHGKGFRITYAHACLGFPLSH
jgi:hypothetical protein